MTALVFCVRFLEKIFLCISIHWLNEVWIVASNRIRVKGLHCERMWKPIFKCEHWARKNKDEIRIQALFVPDIFPVSQQFCHKNVFVLQIEDSGDFTCLSALFENFLPSKTPKHTHNSQWSNEIQDELNKTHFGYQLGNAHFFLLCRYHTELLPVLWCQNKKKKRERNRTPNIGIYECWNSCDSCMLWPARKKIHQHNYKVPKTNPIILWGFRVGGRLKFLSTFLICEMWTNIFLICWRDRSLDWGLKLRRRRKKRIENEE